MKQKIQTLLNQLNHGLVERDGVLKTALLCVLAGENLLLIGPPGTGKSLIARSIAESLTPDSDKDGGYFEYLLTKFSTPEEIFGPLSIQELKADRFKRNISGYLPTVRIAFLDEIFKASSSILNALLTILNERIFHNGVEHPKVPLESLIAASNELPTGQTELDALYDRFLVRYFVDYVSEDGLARLIEDEATGDQPKTVHLTKSDIESIRDAAKLVAIPSEVSEIIQHIWLKHRETFKEDRRESLSDRRLKKVIKLLRVSAAANGRNQVDLSDVFLLKDCLWNHPDNAIKLRELILKTLQPYDHYIRRSNKEANTEIDEEPEQEDVFLDQYYNFIDNKELEETPHTAGKRLAGDGSQKSPFLIGTIDDFMLLKNPEIGLRGYHFRQVQDIYCRESEDWVEFPFMGHYDGGGHTIQGRSQRETRQHDTQQH